MLLVIFFFNLALALREDDYQEELFIARLPSDHHLAQFRFTINSASKELGPNYKYFPRVLGQLFHRHGIQELQFVLTQGLWRTEHYGPPPQPASPTGALLSAKFDGNSSTVDDRWLSLVHSLNGAFCASLISMVPAETYQLDAPKKGDYPDNREVFTRTGMLPREALCTENLTPWRKLLPCKHNGLVSLLNPHRLYGALFHSMGFQIFPQCEGTDCWYRLELFAVVLYDLPIGVNRRLDFSLKTLFDRPLAGKCDAASKSTIHVYQHEEISDLSGSPNVITLNGHRFLTFSTEQVLANRSEGLIHINYRNPVDLNRERPAQSVSLSSTLGGRDGFSATLLTTIKNADNKPYRVIYEQVLPWWVRFFYHSRKVICHAATQPAKDLPVKVLKFSGAIDRKRPAYIQLEMVIPQKSNCIISFEFERAFLRMAEYPPDANHGLYIPAAVLQILAPITTIIPSDGRCVVKNDKEATCQLRNYSLVYSNVLLVPMPVPDFSMPFNVICLVGTAVSLCFGAVHPFSTKILVPVNEKLPGQSLAKMIFRCILLILMAGACYMEYNNISLNALRREIEKFISQNL